jgi:histone-arginine methyltransferase CARM1
MTKVSFIGKMFPTRGDLHVVPFTDEALYMEQYNKVHIPSPPSIFWYIHGLSSSADLDPELTLKIG